MRGLPLRPDDRELFQSIADGEKTAFFMSHQDAFKRMWMEEGKVYWLRFLLAFKRNFESTIMVQPEYQFIFEEEEDERLVSYVFISIHNMFVNCTYSVVHTFVDNIFIAIKHLHNLTEPNKIKNPFFTKESRKAFRAILGHPDEHEDFPPAVIAFALSIYGMFIGAVCILLKRWLKEPDLSEKAKKGIDYTYFYWKPSTDWMDEDYWASCFEKHLADTYKDELPKLLLTANIQNIFVENHDMDCLCHDYGENVNIFEMFRSNRDTDSDNCNRDTDLDYCIQDEGTIKPRVIICKSHTCCYLKVLHSPKCLQPYLCEGSEQCVITCESNIKTCHKNNPTTFWKKVLVETFSCKQPNMRHASTQAQSHNNQIETFVHSRIPESTEITCMHHDEDAEFMMDLLNDPEMMNTFNQHKRKEDYKNKLRTKFRQKYCSTPQDFEDPSFRMNLYENAQKVWLMGVFEENFCKLKPGKSNLDRTSLFDSRESAETTVAVGTSCVLTGRVVTSSVQNGGLSASASEVVEKNKLLPGTSVSNDAKSKSKKSKSKKKKKNKLNGGANEKKDSVPASTDVEKKKDSVHETKEFSAEVAEKGGDTLNKDLTPKSALNGNNHVKLKINLKTLTCEKLIQTEPNKSDNVTSKCKSNNSTGACVKGDVEKEGDRLCFGRCTSQNLSSNGCSSKMCSSCILCKTKEYSTQTNTFQNNSIVITEKPKKTSKDNDAIKITKTDNAVQTIKDIDNCKQVKAEDSNTKSVDSGTLLAVVSSTAIEVNDTSSKDENSLNLKETATVNQNVEQQQLVNNASSCNLKTDQKACVELVESSVINPDVNASDADVLDLNEAINGLTFETEKDKSVEDFLKLIGVVNEKPLISKDEPSPNCDESETNKKGDALLLDRKLKVCGFCGKKEVTYKTFKRCARCKAENFPEQIYYCSRQCQVDDWQESHRDEHLKRSKK